MSDPKFKAAQEVYDLGHFEVAIKYAKEALKSDKKNWQIMNLIGTAFANLGEYDECIRYCKKAIRISKRNAVLIANLGAALQETGNHKAAREYLEEAVSLDPENHKYRTNLALISFLLGDLATFKDNYPSRPSVMDAAVTIPNIAPRYSADVNLNGKNLLIFQEQGIGDEIFFLRLLPEFLKKNSAGATVVCDQRLIGLLSRTFDDVSFISNVNDLESKSNIDFEMPMGDLLLYLDERIPKGGLLTLEPDQSRGLAWKKRIQPLKDIGVTIGISWKGGGNVRFRRKRSIELQDIIQNLPKDAQLVNLQYDYTPEELLKAQNATGRKIWNWDFFDPRYDIENLAGLISNLDAVVSVDNATVHLSGALNCSTLVFLPFDPDYRWGLQDNVSKFYPSVKYIRQEKYDDWSVVNRTSDLLRNVLHPVDSQG